MENSGFDFASSNFIPSIPLTTTKDWTLHYNPEDLISESVEFENSDSCTDLIKTSLLDSPKMKKITPYEAKSSLKLEYVFRSPLQYEKCLGEEIKFVEQPVSGSEFKYPAHKHEFNLENVAYVENSDFLENICFVDGIETCHSLYGNVVSNGESANTDLKSERILSTLNENKSALRKTDSKSCHETFHSKQFNCDVNYDRPIRCPPFDELATSLVDDSCLFFRSAPLTHIFESLKNEWSTYDDFLESQQEDKEPSDILHRTLSSSLCSESTKFNPETDRRQTVEKLPTNSCQQLTLVDKPSSESIEKQQVSESISKNVIADIIQLANVNRFSQIDENYSRLPVAPPLESIGDQNSANSETNDNQCKKNTYTGNSCSTDSETTSETVSDVFKTPEETSVYLTQFPESIFTNHDKQLVDGTPTKETPINQQNSINSEINGNQRKENAYMKNVCCTEREMVSETATYVYETLEKTLDAYLAQLSERGFKNQDNQLVEGIPNKDTTINQQNLVNSGINGHQSKENTCLENIPKTGWETTSETVTDVFETLEETLDAHLTQFSESALINHIKRLAEDTPSNEIPMNQENSANLGINDDQSKENICMESIPNTDWETTSEIATDAFETAEETLDAYLRELSESVEGTPSMETPMTTNKNYVEELEKGMYQKTNLLCQSNVTSENMDVDCELQTFISKNYFTKDCSLTSNLVHCIHCGNCIGFIQNHTNNEVGADVTEDHDTMLNSNVKKLLGLLEVDDILSKSIFLALLNKYMKSGVTQGDILNYLAGISSPASISKLRQKIKLILNVAIDAGIIDKKNRRYFLRITPTTENRLEIQETKCAVPQKSKAKNSGLGNKRKLRERTNMKKTKRYAIRQVQPEARNKSEIQKSKYSAKRKVESENNIGNGKRVPKTVSNHGKESYNLRMAKSDVGNKMENQKNMYTAERKRKADLKDEKALTNVTNTKKMKSVSYRYKPAVANKSEIQKKEYEFKRKCKTDNSKLENDEDLPKMTKIRKGSIPEMVECGGCNSEVPKNKNAVKPKSKIADYEKEKETELSKLTNIRTTRNAMRLKCEQNLESKSEIQESKGIEEESCKQQMGEKIARKNYVGKRNRIKKDNSKIKNGIFQNKTEHYHEENIRKAVNEKCEKRGNTKFPIKRKNTENISGANNKKQKC